MKQKACSRKWEMNSLIYNLSKNATKEAIEIGILQRSNRSSLMTHTRCMQTFKFPTIFILNFGMFRETEYAPKKNEINGSCRITKESFACSVKIKKKKKCACVRMETLGLSSSCSRLHKYSFEYFFPTLFFFLPPWRKASHVPCLERNNSKISSF